MLSHDEQENFEMFFSTCNCRSAAKMAWKCEKLIESQTELGDKVKHLHLVQSHALVPEGDKGEGIQPDSIGIW